MKKKVITIIASILKPVDDTRMYEKFGISLQQSNKYEVNIIGFSAKNKNLHRDIHFYPVFDFPRLGIQRLLAPWKFFSLVVGIKPDLIMIATHELIVPAILYKIIRSKCMLVYDVQENYYRNTIYHASLPKFVKLPLALWIRAKEKFSKHFFAQYFLAEKNYTKEFSFSKRKNTLVLNKYKKLTNIPWIDKNTSVNYQKPVKIVYSGTIHEVYGIWQALDLAKELSKIIAIQFLVIGHVTNTKLLNKLEYLHQHSPWLRLIVDTKPVAHSTIIQKIQQSDFGIVSHQPIPSIANCFPTRIYELMAFQKPILLQDHALWTAFCQRWDSCIPLDFNNFEVEFIADQMLHRKFYQYGPPDDIYWDTEERKLLSCLHNLVEKPSE